MKNEWLKETIRFVVFIENNEANRLKAKDVFISIKGVIDRIEGDKMVKMEAVQICGMQTSKRRPAKRRVK